MGKLQEALLYEKLSGSKVKCNLCAHRCIIAEGETGICKVRKNIRGILYALVYGKLIVQHIDPIEKKPIFHLLPGSLSLSLAASGCNFQCLFCQNWEISQLPRQINFSEFLKNKETVNPAEIVRFARENKCRSISYTYTEPTIFFEYAYEIAKLAQAEGIYNILVTNGYLTPESLQMISPFLNAANVDLKSFSAEFYRHFCKAKLTPVLETIRALKKLGIWVEVTTLLIPGLNDQEEEIKKIADFISGAGKDIPWHISRFHPSYQLIDLPATSLQILHRAREMGKKAGLRYVYTGNIFGDEGENTYCSKCASLLIERFGFRVKNNLVKNLLGKGPCCPNCGTIIEGIIC